MRGSRYKQILNVFSALLVLSLVFTGCRYERSNSTGWEYNNPNNGGFQKVPYVDQETGPGLVFIQGGTFTMGRSEQDVMYDWNNVPRRVTVSSFYLDQTEVTNFDWLEYLYWTKRTYPSARMVYKNALPDTLCWRDPLAFNEPYVEYYLRHPAYRDYPVVGVSWLQATDYCKWRTDRVNEYILIREGLMEMNPMQQDNPFTTNSYLAGQYLENQEEDNMLPDLDPDKAGSGRGKNKFGARRVRMEDGILLPRYRLPTEAEWEFAYYGLIGNLKNPESEVITDRRQYPWNGHWVRQDDAKFQGDIRANFVRGRGDYMGVAGHLNDAADITAPVDSYWPNDYGLYHMAGNVSEWVMDVYRPLSSEDFNEFRPFRGNVFKTKVLSPEGTIDQKYTQTMYDIHGIKEYLNEFERVRYQRIKRKEQKIENPTDSSANTKIRKSTYNQIMDRTNMNYMAGEPDPVYLEKNGVDSVEIRLLNALNEIVDRAIEMQNQNFPLEASRIITEEVFQGIFLDPVYYKEDPMGNFVAHIIPVIRQGISQYTINQAGNLKWREVTEEENINRRNYKHADYIDHLDGDLQTAGIYNRSDAHQFNYDKMINEINSGNRDEDLIMYQNQFESTNLNGAPLKGNTAGWPTTLVSDKSRVYKGGSWSDRAYWIVGSTRRHLDEDQSKSTIGFRCAMDRVGGSKGFAGN